MKRIVTAIAIVGLCASGYAADKQKTDEAQAPQQDLQRMITDESAELKTLMHEFSKKADAARARVDEIVRLKKEIADGDKAIAALEQSQEQLKASVAEKTAALKASEDAAKKSESALAAVNATVIVKDAAIAKAQEQEKALVDQIAALSEAVKGHEALVKASGLVTKERDAYAARVAGLEKNAKAALAAADVSKTEAEAQTVRAEKAESRVAELTKLVAAKDARCTELDARIAASQKALEETKAASAGFQSRAISAEEQNVAHVKTVERLTKDLSDEKAGREKERRDADTVITKLRTELTERKKMIVELISRVQ